MLYSLCTKEEEAKSHSGEVSNLAGILRLRWFINILDFAVRRHERPLRNKSYIFAHPYMGQLLFTENCLDSISHVVEKFQ